MVVKKETKEKKKEDTKKVKAIIFDLWGTIVENGVYPSPTKQTKKILGLFNMPYSEFVLRFEKSFMTQKYDNIKDGLELVFKEFKVNPNEYNRVEKMVGLWNKSKIMAKLYPETKQVLDSLKKDGYKIILLSNLPSTQKDIIERFGFDKYFDHLFLSFEMECIKSEGGFEKLMEETGFSKNELVMVGDSFESDIQSAEKAGIRGILVDRRQTRDYPNKVLTLEELPKMIKEV